MWRVQGCQVLPGRGGAPFGKRKGVQRINPLVRVWAGTRPTALKNYARGAREMFLWNGGGCRAASSAGSRAEPGRVMVVDG